MLRNDLSKRLWIQTEGGEFEPVESYDQIHSRKRGPGTPDWWVVAKALDWKPPRKNAGVGCVGKPNFGGELQPCTPDGRYTFDRGSGSGRGDFASPGRGQTSRLDDIRAEKPVKQGSKLAFAGNSGLGASLLADAGTGKEGELHENIRENEVWGRLDRRGQLKTKLGVDDSRLDRRITDRFGDIEEIFKRHGVPLEITSTYEGTEHKRNSLHYQNKAIDLKGKNVPDDKLMRIVDDLKKALGKDYDIILEKFSDKNRNHIHIEYDPK